MCLALNDTLTVVASAVVITVKVIKMQSPWSRRICCLCMHSLLEIKSTNLINLELLVPGGTEFKDDTVDILDDVNPIQRTCARKHRVGVAPDGSIYFWVSK